MSNKNPNIDNHEELVKLVKRIFSTSDGKDFLSWLERITAYRQPDFNQPNILYFNQGRLSIVQEIKALQNYERKKVCQKTFNP